MKSRRIISVLSALESEVVALFVRVADLLNLPLRWASCMEFSLLRKPMCLDDLRIKLNNSKGSTSRG